MSLKVDATGLPASRPAGASGLVSICKSGADRGGAVGATPSVDKMQLTGESAALKRIEQVLGQDKGAFDARKVEAIRASLADGSYKIDPQMIARRMLDLESELSG